MTTPTTQTPTATPITTPTVTECPSGLWHHLRQFLKKSTDESSKRLIAAMAAATLDWCLIVTTSVICYRAIRNLAIDPQLAIFAGSLVAGVGAVAAIIGRKKDES